MQEINTITTFIFLTITIGFLSCSSEPSPSTTIESEPIKEFWVYQHHDDEGRDYTVFSTEKPANKAALPSNFLAIKNRKKEKWNCLLKWEGDVLWFYTPSSRSFASHNSDNGKTQWTIIEEEDFNYFFFEKNDDKYIRFSNDCSQTDILCLESDEMHVVGDFY